MDLDEREKLVRRLSLEIGRILFKREGIPEVVMGVLADCAATFSSRFTNGHELIEEFCKHCRDMDAIYRKKREEG